MLEKNISIWLTTHKKTDDIQYTLKYLDIPESKKDIGKYSIVHFNTPAPPKPDSLPGIFSNTWPDIEEKNLPVGQWW